MSQLSLFANESSFSTDYVTSVAELLAIAQAFGIDDAFRLTTPEKALLRDLPAVCTEIVSAVRRAIQVGHDPLGEAYCTLKSAEERRPDGATYTPARIVKAMTRWAQRMGQPVRIVDTGAGSGRFTIAAGLAFPNAHLVAIEKDPTVALLLRGHIATAGLANRTTVIVADYRTVKLPSVEGPTLFWGNPPYVRHHLLDAESKLWLAQTARKFGIEASKLAGLHAYFFLATAALAAPGDYGMFITASEWLDVNYGRLIRQLLVQHLGLESLHVIEPEVLAFDDAATTAVITGFQVGHSPESVGLQRINSIDALGALASSQYVNRQRFAEADRWTPLTRVARAWPEGFVELGELCRVHRGQVTGANKIWIDGAHSGSLPASVLFPAITKAAELIKAEQVLNDVSHLRRIIDLPTELDCLESDERGQVEKFLLIARRLGAQQGYIAQHRRAWWAVGLREPAPILATYMARRPPAFVRNLGQARHINIAHGLYPRIALTEPMLLALTSYLTTGTSLHQGRTYAGGLTKFEPREMERLMVPSPELLANPTALFPTAQC